MKRTVVLALVLVVGVFVPLWGQAGDFIDDIENHYAYRAFIEKVGRMNAEYFAPYNFRWNNATETLSYGSTVLYFTGTDWGFVHSHITFYKVMELQFRGRNIVGAQWRYVYLSANSWFGVGNPSQENPVYSNWYTTAVPNNNVSGSGVDGVINTLIHFDVRLGLGDEYRFIRGNGSITTLTVEGGVFNHHF